MLISTLVLSLLCAAAVSSAFYLHYSFKVDILTCNSYVFDYVTGYLDMLSEEVAAIRRGHDYLIDDGIYSRVRAVLEVEKPKIIAEAVEVVKAARKRSSRVDVTTINRDGSVTCDAFSLSRKRSSQK